jgi:hypothetical protein
MMAISNAYPLQTLDCFFQTGMVNRSSAKVRDAQLLVHPLNTASAGHPKTICNQNFPNVTRAGVFACTPL